MIDWFKKHRVLFALICVVILLLLMGVPFVINILFKINATTDILVAEWSAGDALGYYGAILSFLGTVVLGALALYQNHIIKTEADKKAALAEEQERAENMYHIWRLRHYGEDGILLFYNTTFSQNSERLGFGYKLHCRFERQLQVSLYGQTFL